MMPVPPPAAAAASLDVPLPAVAIGAKGSSSWDRKASRRSRLPRSSRPVDIGLKP
jgi:hypothetical protein